MAPESPGPWTVLSLLNWTKDYFARRNVDSPRLSAEILLASCLNCKRIELYTRFDYQPTSNQLAVFHGLVDRAGAHEPVAYLVGEKEFYSLRIKVTADVLIPRPETEALVTEAISHLRGGNKPGSPARHGTGCLAERRGKPTTMWDVCTGSGCVAVAVAKNVQDLTVLATDISQKAIAIAADNANAHGVADRVRCCCADLLMLPDQVKSTCPKTGFDVITANPPYVAAQDPVARQVEYEPQLALRAGEQGLEYIRRIIADSPAWICPGGILAIEFGCGQADAVGDLIVSSKAFDEPRILRDHQDMERTAVATRRA